LSRGSCESFGIRRGGEGEKKMHLPRHEKKGKDQHLIIRTAQARGEHSSTFFRQPSRKGKKKGGRGKRLRGPASKKKKERELERAGPEITGPQPLGGKKGKKKRKRGKRHSLVRLLQQRRKNTAESAWRVHSSSQGGSRGGPSDISRHPRKKKKKKRRREECSISRK